MVQLPATAAIEYVAACWVSGASGRQSTGRYVCQLGDSIRSVLNIIIVWTK